MYRHCNKSPNLLSFLLLLQSTSYRNGCWAELWERTEPRFIIVMSSWKHYTSGLYTPTIPIRTLVYKLLLCGFRHQRDFTSFSKIYERREIDQSVRGLLFKPSHLNLIPRIHGKETNKLVWCHALIIQASKKQKQMHPGVF